MEDINRYRDNEYGRHDRRYWEERNRLDIERERERDRGRDIPNTPMLGALIKATGILDFKEMFEDTKHKLEKKFKSKPEVIEGNLKAIERAYNEVRS